MNEKKYDFLADFLGESTPVGDLSKSVVKHDKYDEEDKESLIEQLPDFAGAEDRLVEFTETGGTAFADSFFALVKANPTLEDQKEVRPSHQINRMVLSEAMKLNEYEELRSYCTGDDIASALATVQMEPRLETLFDKTKTEQKMLDELQKQMQQFQELQQEMHDLDQMMEQAAQDDLDEQDEPQDYQSQKALIQQAMEALAAQIQEGAEAAAEALGMAESTIRMMMKSMMSEALEEASQMELTSMMWGLEPGALHRMPADERIALAKKLNSEKFRRIAALFGPMHRMAFAEQQRKTIHSRDEVYDISMGNDISRLLLTELVKLHDEDLQLDFIRRFIEGELLQYELRGTEKLAKGGIIFCEDGSGSMGGDREVWAKAVGLCLLQIAKAQKRSFYAIHFGSPGEYKCFDFRDTSSITVDRVIEFAELFFCGGTDFVTPLSKSLDIMQEEYDAKGCVKADIVFVTDGQCGVDDTWLKNFKTEQERLNFRVYGIIIGGHPDSDPLKTIADGRVMTIKSLVDGDDVRELFRGV